MATAALLSGFWNKRIDEWGHSESSTANVKKSSSESKVKSKKKETKKPPSQIPPLHRTAMGEYIPPIGGTPLSSHGGNCNPAPSDYCPNIILTKSKAAEYSIGGRKQSPLPPYNVGPADYNTSGRMQWDTKTMTIKGKGKTVTGGKQAEYSVPPPSQYKVNHLETGTGGPQYTMGNSWKRSCVSTGPPHSLVQPSDTHGFVTPGPAYRPNSSSDRGPMKSFGSSRRDRLLPEIRPGPAEYSLIMEDNWGPAYSFGKRLPKASFDGTPAPDAYEIGSTIGKSVAKSMASRQKDIAGKCKLDVPAPNMYTLPDNLSDARTAPLAYRWFEEAEKPHPGPDRYTVTNIHLPKAPGYTFRKRTVPTLADEIQEFNVPGPGSYNLSAEFTSNDGPKYTMGKPGRRLRKYVPGPNKYNIIDDKNDAPKISMAKRFDAPRSNKNYPGPAAYYPRVKNSGPKYSISVRSKGRKGFVTPAANSYRLFGGQTIKGTTKGPTVTLKSRASPMVYSGIEASRVRDPK